jgi:hypothetical protein
MLTATPFAVAAFRYSRFLSLHTRLLSALPRHQRLPFALPKLHSPRPLPPSGYECRIELEPECARVRDGRVDPPPSHHRSSNDCLGELDWDALRSGFEKGTFKTEDQLTRRLQALGSRFIVVGQDLHAVTHLDMIDLSHEGLVPGGWTSLPAVSAVRDWFEEIRERKRKVRSIQSAGIGAKTGSIPYEYGSGIKGDLQTSFCALPCSYLIMPPRRVLPVSPASPRISSTLPSLWLALSNACRSAISKLHGGRPETGVTRQSVKTTSRTLPLTMISSRNKGAEEVVTQ